jgi:peptidoglycan hydrolase-like protein with peptidoglycan-binding domain
LDLIKSKEDRWSELINHGYKLGDRILNFSEPELRGSDVEELQELLSRLGFYSEPINGVFNIGLETSVIKFQENKGLSVDGNVGLGTVHEIRMLMRPNLNTSLNEAIKSIAPN